MKSLEDLIKDRFEQNVKKLKDESVNIPKEVVEARRVIKKHLVAEVIDAC